MKLPDQGVTEMARASHNATKLFAGLLASWLLLPMFMAHADEAAPTAALPRVELLRPQQLISGGRLAARTDANGFPLPGALQGYVNFVFPSAVAVRGQDVYVADSGKRKLYRIDTALQVVSEVQGVDVVTWTRLRVAPDHSLFVLDASQTKILRYTRGGRLLQTFRDPLTTARMVDFSVSPSMDRVVVLDALNQQLVALHPSGKAGQPLDVQGVGALAAQSGVAASGRQLYVIDSGCNCVAVLDEQGRARAQIGKGVLTLPRALAVDSAGRVFVVDAADRTLKIFQGGALVASYQARALRLTEFSDLAIDDNWLYVADGPGARIAVFRIAPTVSPAAAPAMEPH